MLSQSNPFAGLNLSPFRQKAEDRFKLPFRVTDRPSYTLGNYGRAYQHSIEFYTLHLFRFLEEEPAERVKSLLLDIQSRYNTVINWNAPRVNADGRLNPFKTIYSRGRFVPPSDETDFQSYPSHEVDETCITVEQRDCATGHLVGFRHYVLEGSINGNPALNIQEVVRIATEEARKAIVGVADKKIAEAIAQSDNISQLTEKAEAQIAAREKKLQLEIERFNEQKREFEAARVTKTECPYAAELVKDFKPTDEVMNSPCVYLLYAGGRFKIGYTKCLDKRLMQLQTGTPYPIDIVCALITNNPQGLEWELHQRFAEQRVYGEWFTLTDDDVRYIHALAEAA